MQWSIILLDKKLKCKTSWSFFLTFNWEFCTPNPLSKYLIDTQCFQRHIRQTGAQLNSSSDATKQSVPTEADVVVIGGGRLAQSSYLQLLTIFVAVLAARPCTTWPRWGSPTRSSWRRISSQRVRYMLFLNTGFLS